MLIILKMYDGNRALEFGKKLSTSNKRRIFQTTLIINDWNELMEIIYRLQCSFFRYFNRLRDDECARGHRASKRCTKYRSYKLPKYYEFCVCVYCILLLKLLPNMFFLNFTSCPGVTSITILITEMKWNAIFITRKAYFTQLLWRMDCKKTRYKFMIFNGWRGWRLHFVAKNGKKMWKKT